LGKKASTETKGDQVSYKPSRYNHFFLAEEGYYLAYNAFSNSFAKVPTKNYGKICQILEDPGNKICENEEYLKLKRDLIRGGFLIDSCLDEFAVLNSQNRIGRFANRVLNLTIAPTLACNFRCTYCFETPKSDTMDDNMEKKIVEFVDKKMETLTELQVSWFGGEPLLRLDIIDRLTVVFKGICEKKDAAFRPAAIVTNGYLLTKDTAEHLKQANITSAQVTLDGVPDIHDRRRKLVHKNEVGTFWKILNNIKEASDIISIMVRINIDKENCDTMEAFYKLWKEEGLMDKVFFYFGQVRAITGACADNAFQCFNSKEYSELIVKLYLQAMDIGISNVKYPSLQKYGCCCADNLNGYVIAPNGYIFKCWEEISGEAHEAIGNIINPEMSSVQIMNNTRYLNWDPFTNNRSV
jgi:uncharacterized protein